MEFGSYLRDLRTSRQLTQRQLADAIDVHFTYISKIENNLVDPPSERTIRKLAGVLAVDPEELLVRAAKVGPELREAAAQEPQLALLLRTISRKQPSPEQYQMMLDILDDEDER